MSNDPTLQGLPANIRFICQTVNGWQGADHPDGPWRPIPAPQTQPSFPVAAPAETLAARPLLEEVARMGDRIGQHTVREITAISDRAAAWLRENPTGQPKPAPDPTPAAAEPPLWRVMVRAYDTAPAPLRDAPDSAAPLGCAEEILAVRDWLKQRLPEGGAWHVLLTTEAARAEAGE